MAVINQHGVVGRIVKCSPRSSRVLLLIDASSALATLVERTRTRSICRGTGDALSLDYVALPEDVAEGDLIVTSGLGGVFPKGLPVGSVRSVVRGGFSMFQTIEIAPAVDFSRIEEVMVLRNEPLPQ
jgi:rod shape-determining protein MreC